MDGCRGVRGVLIKGRRVTWACVPHEGRGEIPGGDRGFGCAGEGDGTGRWARTVSGLGQRATLVGGTGGSGRMTRGRAGGCASGGAGLGAWALGTGLGPSWAGPGVWALVWAARKGLDWVLVCWALGLGFLSFSIPYSSPFLNLFQTKFEFKYEFEFKPHSNKSMHQHECNTNF